MNRRGRPILSIKRRAEDYPPPTPQPSACRIWQGVVDRDGYGYVMVPNINKRQRKPAHRWVWEQANGPIPPRMVVRHKCDNPPCFRLSHLELGTVADNNNDALVRGRQWARPALSPMQSWRVLELLEGGWNERQVAEGYFVSMTAVRRIKLLGREGLAEYLKGMDPHGDMDAAPTVHRDQDRLGVGTRKGYWSTPFKPHEWQRPAG